MEKKFCAAQDSGNEVLRKYLACLTYMHTYIHIRDDHLKSVGKQQPSRQSWLGWAPEGIQKFISSDGHPQAHTSTIYGKECLYSENYPSSEAMYEYIFSAISMPCM
jgi:hypothetical protein